MNETDRTGDVFLTTQEVAKRLRVGRAAVAVWVRANKLPAVKFGRRWLIPAAALDQALALMEEGMGQDG